MIIQNNRAIRTDVSLSFDVDVDSVLEQLDDVDLQAAIERRDRRRGKGADSKLTLIYEEFARRGDAPQVLKDFIYETIGRIL